MSDMDKNSKDRVKVFTKHCVKHYQYIYTTYIEHDSIIEQYPLNSTESVQMLTDIHQEEN